MMTRRFLVSAAGTSALVAITVAGGACATSGGGGGPRASQDGQGVSYHLAQSEQHARAADAQERELRGAPETASGQRLQCADDPLAGVSTTGTERYQVMRPCWTSVVNPTEAERRAAERHRDEAARHRLRAEQLVAAEAAACAGLGKAEVSQSPLTHAKDIVAVTEVREGARLLGVRVVLRRVSGLTPDWLRRSLACHQARAAALGHPPRFMADCPMTLPGVTAEVRDERDGLAVILTAEREEIAAAILGRALDLLEPRTDPEL